MHKPRLIRAREAADLLGISVWRLYLEARAGALPGVVRIGAKSLRFDLERLERFVREGGAPAKPAA